jgi:glycosyltransferase involved in cell wall biosynthesis
MRIGFDGKRAANNTTGLGNYSRTLITQLAVRFPKNQYFIYTEKLSNNLQITSFFKQRAIALKLRLPSASKFLWRTFGIRKQLIADNIDIYHGLSYEIPIGLRKNNIKSVVTIHDLIYLKFPQFYTFFDRQIYNLKSRYACVHSDRIVAISERTKQDITEHYHIDPDKIKVIYQSCDSSFKKAISEDVLETTRNKYGLPQKYILNVGTIEPRKNLLLIIRSLNEVHADYKLVVIGKQQAYMTQVRKEILELKLTERVLFLEDLPFADLPPIYQSASAFIYPSLYEGFGIPIIEALFSKVPVVAATGSCLEEAGGPNSIYIDPYDSKSLSVQINRVLTDVVLCKTMIEKGYDYAQKFDDHLLAQQMMQCYETTLTTNEPDAENRN